MPGCAFRVTKAALMAMLGVIGRGAAAAAAAAAAAGHGAVAGTALGRHRFMRARGLSSPHSHPHAHQLQLCSPTLNPQPQPHSPAGHTQKPISRSLHHAAPADLDAEAVEAEVGVPVAVLVPECRRDLNDADHPAGWAAVRHVRVWVLGLLVDERASAGSGGSGGKLAAGRVNLLEGPALQLEGEALKLAGKGVEPVRHQHAVQQQLPPVR